MYRIIVAILCVALAEAQLDCNMVPSDKEYYGFISTGPAGGTFISEFLNQFSNINECNQECCNQAATVAESNMRCRAAWFYNNTAAGVTVCQLWNCDDCDAEGNTMEYPAQYQSRLGFWAAAEEDEQTGTTEEETIPDQYGIPNQDPQLDSQGYPLQNQVPVIDNQGYPSSNPASPVDSQGYPMPPNQGYPVNNQALPQDYPEAAPINPQTSYDDQQQIVEGSNPADTVQTAANQQGTWVYNPATGEYTFQPAGDTPVPETAQQGNDQYQEGQQQLIPGQEGSNIIADPADPLLTSQNNTLIGDSPYQVLDNEDEDDDDYDDDDEDEDDDDDGWNWWPFGNFGKDGDDDDDYDEEYEEEMKEWEEEEKEYEEEEKEYEEWREEQEKLEGMSTDTYTSTTPGYVTDSWEGEVDNDDDDDEWFENLMGDGDDEVEHFYSTPSPKNVDNQLGEADNYYRPDTFSDMDEDDSWGIDAVNAPVIAVGACAAVVLLLLLLVFVGRKLTGKTERAQYKPLKESFSGSSTYHEDI